MHSLTRANRWRSRVAQSVVDQGVTMDRLLAMASVLVVLAPSPQAGVAPTL